MSFSLNAAGQAAWAAQNAAKAAQQNPAGYPTSGFATGTSGALTPAQISQWQNYFNTGAGATPAMTNQLVQTGSTYSPDIPWMTGGQGISGIVGGSGATNQNTGLNLPWGSLGITPSSNPQTMANNINASPYAGSNPSDPYYNLVLNQAGAGAQTPTYTMEQVPTSGGGGQYAQMVGGQLIGNLTPQEQQLANYYGLSPGQGQYLPDVMNYVQAAGPQTSASAQGTIQNALMAAGAPGVTPESIAQMQGSWGGFNQ